MSNEELLATPKEHLTPIDRQRQHTLLLASLEQSCPVCQCLVNVFTAAGIEVNEYDFSRTPTKFQCPHCQARLDYVVPIIGLGSPWRWQLNTPWLREQLNKAKAWDQYQEEP